MVSNLGKEGPGGTARYPGGTMGFSRIQCHTGKLLRSGHRGHRPDSSHPRWVSVTARTMWLMSGPNTRMWTGTSTRYSKRGGRENVPVALGGSGLSLGDSVAASLNPT